MAALNAAGIAAALNVVLADQLYNQFRSDSVELNLLEVKPANGENLVYPVKFYAREAGGAYAEGADMTDADYDSHEREKATFGWAGYRAGVKVTDESQDIAAATPGGLAGSVLDEEITDAIGKMRDDVGKHIYTGNPSASPRELAGAEYAIASAGTFGGLDPSDYDGWKASVESIPLEDLSKSELRRKLIRPVRDATGRYPDFVTCDGEAWDLVADLFEESSDTVQEIRLRDGSVIDIYAAAGMRALILDGVPIIESRHAPAKSFFAWTRADVRLRFVPPAAIHKAQAGVYANYVHTLTGEYISEDDVRRRLEAASARIQPIIAPMSKTGASTALMLRTPLMQLQWRSRRGFARLNLTTAE